MEEITPGGTAPGWMYGHRASAVSADEVRVSGGKIVTWDGHEETHADNAATFILHTTQNVWTAANVI